MKKDQYKSNKDLSNLFDKEKFVKVIILSIYSVIAKPNL